MHCSVKMLWRRVFASHSSFSKGFIFLSAKIGVRDLKNLIVVSPSILMFFLYPAGTRIELAVRPIIIKARRLKARNYIINGGACFGRNLFRILRLLLPVVIHIHGLYDTAPRGGKHYMTRISTHILSSFLFSIYLL